MSSAEKFIGATTFAALIRRSYHKLFYLPKAGLEHIEMAFKLDAIIVLPALIFYAKQPME